ncbi:hypothetical protein [Salinirubrum litoreum]|uniref:Uncharacterized protein n=1 Tax=Salinirubrum litoreum TaxID=1126234 RepID=A0ABD5R6L3_9EURY|nr:hypothetical protein [Salinirubrum litoreum]
MTGYYDYVLAFIPLALLGITGALAVAGVGLTAAIPAAASVSALAIGHALFVNAPVDAPSPTADVPNAEAVAQPVQAD